jgi:hypothetical protein
VTDRTEILRRLFVRADWMEDAACKGHQHPDWWFPAAGYTPNTAAAKDICAVCPVAEQCLAYALANDERSGIWGGQSIDVHRRRNRGQRPTKPPTWKRPLQPINHGTYSGYQQERRRGEIPCDECRDARNEFRRTMRTEGRTA